MEKPFDKFAFPHRIVLCGVSLCLLWLSTLRVSIAIVGNLFPVYSYSDVKTACTFAYTESEDQRNKYESCAYSQLSVCTDQLNDANIRETDRSSAALAANAVMIDRANSKYSACVDDCSQATDIINLWISSGHGMILSDSAICPDSQQFQVQRNVKESSSLRNGLLLDVDKYAARAESTFRSLYDYSNELSDYNKNYILNKTGRIKADNVEAFVRAQAQLIPRSIQNISVIMGSMSLSLDQLIACVGLANNTQGRSRCSGGLGMYDQYVSLQNSMLIQRSLVERQLNDFSTVLNAYMSKVNIAISNANSFYDSVSGAQGIISYVLRTVNTFGSISDLCSHSSPNFCSFSKSDWYVYPAIPPDPIQALLINLPNAYTLWAPALNEARKAQTALNKAAAALKTTPNALLSSLHAESYPLNAKNLGLADYNPPQYTAINSSAQDASPKNFSASVRLQLDAITASLTKVLPANINSTSIADFSTRFIVGGDRIELSVPSFTHASWSPPGVQSLDVFNYLHSILNILYFMDTIYRLWLSVRVVRKHWSDSLVDMPLCDIRCYQDENNKENIKARGSKNSLSEKTHTARWPPTRWISNFCRSSYSVQKGSPSTFGAILILLTNAWVHVLIVVAGVTFAVYCLLALYIPVYQGYASYCDAHTSFQGTFITRNLNSIAINFAAGPGNRIIANSILDYNLNATQHCSRSHTASSDKYQNQSNVWTNLNSNRKTQIVDLKSLISCVNGSAANLLYKKYCTNATSSNLNSCPLNPKTNSRVEYLGNLFFSDECSSDWADGIVYQPFDGTFHTDAVYNCSFLPACSTTCSGPQKAILNTVTDQCGCTAEGYVHSIVIYFGVAMLVYALLNISRVLLCKGLIRLNWKDLTNSSHFEFIGSSYCETGEIVIPKISHNLKVDDNGSSTWPMCNQCICLNRYFCGQGQHALSDVTSKNIPTVDEFVGFNPLKAKKTNLVGASQEILVDQNKLRTMAAMLKLNYRQTCHSYEISGWMLVVGSVVVNCPWIMLLYYFNNIQS